ncbi:GTP cyclohydrolase FolE2 [Silvanigrella aquatica]|uniref:GTP cyclohydrolase FolE2 n=1 Tax=Silvanigrella aquatica TaxID=1915309 RepID=A0A1L4CZA1_9BACT|nr:GTP cyclohydrolase FolE2 [Silvanigrella aquatica]APJ03267.1 GTP cyclohydrolase [Silvanigrella aquatica]
MQDTQNIRDQRMVKISKVGIKEVSHPLFFYDRDEKESAALPSTGVFSFFVELPAEKKGTHMSRFPSILYEFAPYFNLKKFEHMAHEINEKLQSDTAFIETKFTYFYEKFAPVSKTRGLTDIKVALKIKAKKNSKNTETQLTLQIPVTSLCPCSKAISENGAHSQRSHMTLSLWNPKLSIKECIEVAEKAASCAIYPVLKRVDEKFVTEKAYNTPRFVEDLVREAAIQLKEKNCALRFEVSAENFESIHNHNAWAMVKSDDL